MPRGHHLHPRSGSSSRLAPRHTKGILTLTLLLFAETVTFVNAKSFWNILQQQADKKFFATGSFASRSQQETTCLTETSSDESASCPSSPTLSRLLPRRHRLVQPPGRTADCCSANALQQCRDMPRGGGAADPDALPLVSSTTPYGIPLNGWKVLFQALLTAINVLCWLIPLKSKKMSDNKLALGLANAFSGGVFLSLAFGHLIPECIHGFSDYSETTPFLLVLAGYLLIFFVEKVAFADAHELLHEMEHASEPQHQHQSNGTAAAPAQSSSSLSLDSTASGTSGRSALILLGALAVHSILEMMALGLSDRFADSALLTLSIALHQPAESIALLVAFLKSGMPKSQILQYLSIFSCMGPIGVALGMAVNEYAAPIVDSIMLAIVAGTFVYVGATEVIPEEFHEGGDRWIKFGALVAGIGSILVITQYTMSLDVHG